MKVIQEVYDFYNAGAEIGSLEIGLGKIEHLEPRRLYNNILKRNL